MKRNVVILAAAAAVLIVLAGVILAGGHPQEHVENVGDSVDLENINAGAYEIPLKAKDFKNFEMTVPEGSDFMLKNNLTDVGKGMRYYENEGNFSDDVPGIAISENMTGSLILNTMELVKDNGTKVYSSKNVGDDFYQAVASFNGTDIIVSGSNLHLIEEMLNSTTVKNTSNLVKTVKAPVKKTPVQKVVEKTKKTSKKAEKTVKPKVERTTEKATTYPLVIGGGMFSTASSLSDRTNAKIYVGPEHTGETVKIKILYSRDGKALNKGNLVTKTVESDGYIYVASADAYTKYPDYATVKVYDWQGNLQSTQGISLETKSGTQYF